DKVPELALRQIFGRQKLPEDLCLLLADKGMLSVEGATIKAIGGDDTKFGPDEPARELSLTLLAAIWKLASTLQEHVATRKFVERIHCDYMVHGTVAFYEMDRLHVFFVAHEYLKICNFLVEAGPLKYLSELEEWRHKNKGLSKVYKFSNDKWKDFPTFSSALKEVLQNHKQLENDARSTAELDKFKQTQIYVSPTAPAAGFGSSHEEEPRSP
ncbi:TGFBRAP1, partial [Symbiodinium necroappetens]